MYLFRNFRIENGNGTVELIYAILPTEISLSAATGKQFLCGLTGKDKSVLVQGTSDRVDGSLVVGNFTTSYSPGDMFSKGYDLVMMPLIGENVFFATEKKAFKVSIDVNTAQITSAKNWFADWKRK
jgi:hypothetical protein